ncbi:GAF domain-containing protein [Pseudomarimonas salicorniae]|uniref:GAF domain-containing protein n=1 Tax=Pseudomarimonas salicorniae TaxID=2933270 RepID=A0ABT0GGY8_9GAMM|nr:GAF domain-containing protein [Lysobacter sp. CAU 1642]MCK7593780.1 GAF domain-containing protein [Lysobacter sp. CAU 1642]
MSPPNDEFSRQRALDTYRIVDSLPEPAYDDIVQLASMICNVPVAMVSLIDRDRQWFKARLGTELRETAREVAFCDHAIRQPRLLMEVQDTADDPRFRENPLVTGETGVRFYAGMPLVTPGGEAIGTVCVLDQQPRELDEAQRASLAALARLTMNLLDGRHRERELERNALLATVAAAEVVPVDSPQAHTACSVVIFEVQDYAGAVHTRGERTLERALARLEQMIDAELGHARGDSVSRVSGGAEVIAVLHGDDCLPRIEAMRQAVAAFEQDSGLRVLCASADSDPAGESAPSVFLRADQALSRLKDQLADRAPSI